MKKNIGITDRIVRFVLFDLFIGANLSALDLSTGWQVVFGVAAMNFLFTVIFGYSLLYSVLRIDTVYRKEVKISEERFRP